MKTLVDTLYDLWFESYPHHTLSVNEMTKILSSLTDAMSLINDQNKLGSSNSAYFIEDQKHCFLQIWQLLAIYEMQEAD